MKKNEKYDKVIAKFDRDYIQSKFDGDGINAPENLNAENVEIAISNKKQKIIPFVKTKSFKTVVSLVACIAIIAVSLNFALNNNAQSSPVTDDYSQNENAQISTFSSAKDVEKYFKTIEKSNKNKGYAVYKGMDTAKSAESTTDNSYSETYVQVDGVDEADIIKNDGKYIYTASNEKDCIYIYQPDSKTAKRVSEIKYDAENDYYVDDFFLYNNNLIVLSYNYKDSDNFANVDVFSLSDIKKPKKIHSFSQQGNYVSSRITNGSLLLVSNREIYSSRCKNENDYLPKTTADGKEKYVLPKDICKADNSETSAYLIISKIDLESQKMTSETKAVAGCGTTVYCNENNLYVSNSYYDVKASSKNSEEIYAVESGDMNTDIYKINFENGIVFSAKATVSGYVNNQFSMDEYNGNLRIATTENDGKSGKICNAYVFDKSLKRLGKTENFAKGEDIRAVRFLGDTAYVITYKNTDPLFVIDLSNPSKPLVKGSVKISGFSTNLIPIDDSTILGIGSADDFSNPYANGVKFVLFDVSNPEKPRVLDSEIVYNALSSAQGDHRAILINKDKNYFAIPYEDVKGNDSGVNQIKVGAIAFEVENKKINIIKKYSTKVSGWDDVRSTIVNDVIYTFSGGKFVNSFTAK